MKYKLFVLLTFLICSFAEAKLPQVIRVCDDAEEWPPYTFYKRENREKTKEVTGYSVEYLKRIFESKGISFTIDLLPWKTCLDELKAGKYDLTLNGSFNAERNHSYLISRAYYALSPVYFFDKTDTKPSIRKIEDLKKYKLCGVNAYNYQAGFLLSPSMIDTSSKGIAQAFLKLKNHDCQIIPERLEIVLSYKNLGIFDYESLGLSFEAIPGAEPIPFHMLLSRNSLYANELLEILNQGIKEMSSQDKVKDLNAKYSIPRLLTK